MTGDIAADFTRAFFDNCEKASAKAATYRLTLAAFSIKLSLFDPTEKFGLETLRHALSAYDIGQDDTGYAIYVIDSEHYSELLPPRCWDTDDIAEDQSIRGFAANNCYTALNVNNGTFLLADRTNKRAIQVFGLNNEPLPHWDYFSPLRKILNQFIIDTDYVLVHAGGLGAVDNDDGIILTGAGRSGKSTICGMSVGGDIAYAGDDFLLIDTKNSYAYCLYTSLKAREHLDGFFDGQHIFKQCTNDAVAAFREADPGRIYMILPPEKYNFLKRRIRIKAILKPIYNPTLQQVSLTAVPASTMIRYMALSTLYITSGDDNSYEKNFLKMSRLVKNISGFEFHYNADSQQVNASIHQIIFQ